MKKPSDFFEPEENGTAPEREDVKKDACPEESVTPDAPAPESGAVPETAPDAFAPEAGNVPETAPEEKASVEDGEDAGDKGDDGDGGDDCYIDFDADDELDDILRRLSGEQNEFKNSLAGMYLKREKRKTFFKGLVSVLSVLVIIIAGVYLLYTFYGKDLPYAGTVKGFLNPGGADAETAKTADTAADTGDKETETAGETEDNNAEDENPAEDTEEEPAPVQEMWFTDFEPEITKNPEFDPEVCFSGVIDQYSAAAGKNLFIDKNGDVTGEFYSDKSVRFRESSGTESFYNSCITFTAKNAKEPCKLYYCFYDINGDGAEEMFVSVSCGEYANEIFDIYWYNEKEDSVNLLCENIECSLPSSLTLHGNGMVTKYDPLKIYYLRSIGDGTVNPVQDDFRITSGSGDMYVLFENGNPVEKYYTPSEYDSLQNYYKKDDMHLCEWIPFDGVLNEDEGTVRESDVAAEYEMILKDVAKNPGVYYNAPGTFAPENNLYSICDIDGDGIKELLIKFSDAVASEQFIGVWRYSTGTRKAVRSEGELPVNSVFYSNGNVTSPINPGSNYGGNTTEPFGIYTFSDGVEYIFLYTVEERTGDGKPVFYFTDNKTGKTYAYSSKEKYGEELSKYISPEDKLKVEFTGMSGFAGYTGE